MEGFILVHNHKDWKTYWSGKGWEHSSWNRPKIYKTLAGATRALRMFEGFRAPEIVKV